MRKTDMFKLPMGLRVGYEVCRSQDRFRCIREQNVVVPSPKRRLVCSCNQRSSHIRLIAMRGHGDRELFLPSVDAVSFSSGLTILREALRTHRAPSFRIDRHSTDTEHERVATRLRSLLSAIRGRPALYASPLAMVDSVNDAQAARLKAMVQRLSASWNRHVHGALGLRKAAILRDLLEVPIPSILGIFRKEMDENAHSDVLRWLLDPKTAPGVGPGALWHLAGALDGAEGWRADMQSAIHANCVVVRREVQLGRSLDSTGRDRVDLLVSGPGFVLAIENKVTAQEHENQTDAYWNWLERQYGRRGGLFLTPTGIRPNCQHFAPVSYLQLLVALLEGPARAELAPRERSVLAGYVRTLATSVLRTELRRYGRDESWAL
jgi:PD-(D/E)XK nuclease superfamily